MNDSSAHMGRSRMMPGRRLQQRTAAVGSSPLGRAMQLLAAAFEIFVQECDERQQAEFLRSVIDIAARHQARRLDRERRAA